MGTNFTVSLVYDSNSVSNFVSDCSENTFLVPVSIK